MVENKRNEHNRKIQKEYYIPEEHMLSLYENSMGRNVQLFRIANRNSFEFYINISIVLMLWVSSIPVFAP